MKIVDINPLLDLTGIVPRPTPGIISLTDRMEPPEENPRNDWLYGGLTALRELSKERKINKAACIGTGQAIDAIAVAHLFHPDTLYITDIVEDLLAGARENFEHNTTSEHRPKHVEYLAGRDCEPLPEKVDLITFSPPPLMVYGQNGIDEGIARTTIIEAEKYLHHAKDTIDPLVKWSTLPQYVFLLSAKEKLNPGGITVTLYTGRIPFNLIQETYGRAGFKLEVLCQMMKRQTDPQYLAEYAKYERERLGGDMFDFYDFEQAKLLLAHAGIELPGLVIGHTDESLKEILRSAKIGAVKAYEASLSGKEVAHVGYALLGGSL